MELPTSTRIGSKKACQATPLMPEKIARRVLIGIFGLLVAVQIAYLGWIGKGLGKFTDSFSEANVIRAVDAYLHDGITSHHGLARSIYGNKFPGVGFVVNRLDAQGQVPAEFRQGFPESAAAPDEWVYTHYPPGPEIVCWVLASPFGIERLWVLRLFPLCLCLLAAAVFFRALARAFGTDRAALVAGACVLLPMFNTYMPGLHFQGYSWALFLLQLSLLMRMYWTQAAVPRWCWAALFLLGFVQGWLSFDQFFVVGLIAWPLWLLRRSEGGAPSRRHLALPVILAFAGFGFAHVLHFLQVAAELGGPGAAFTEFRNTAAERLNQAGTVVPQMLQRPMFAFLQEDSARVSYSRSLILGVYQYIRDFLRPDQVQFFPLLPLAVVLGVLAAWFQRIAVNLPCSDKSRPPRLSLLWPNDRRAWWSLFAALFISTVWLLVLPAHSVGNHHVTVRHFFVFYFLLVLILVQSLQVSRPGQTGAGDAVVVVEAAKEPWRALK
jgi:hypothetical protein